MLKLHCQVEPADFLAVELTDAEKATLTLSCKKAEPVTATANKVELFDAINDHDYTGSSCDGSIEYYWENTKYDINFWFVSGSDTVGLSVEQVEILIHYLSGSENQG